MATSAVSPASTASTFNGSSQFATQLGNEITKEVALASVPLEALQTDQTTVSNELAAEQSLQSVVNTASSALQSLASATTSTLSASVSVASVLQATTSASAQPGTYTVQVTDPGSSTNAMSDDGLPTVTDPTSQSISTSSSFTLTAGSSTYQIDPSSNNLQDLADAINSSGAPVQATIINIGGSTPDYRLALQATTIGSAAVQLNDGSSDLLNTLVGGTDATYTVNGQPSTPISSSSRTVTIAPGLTANLEAAGSTTITVANSAANVSNELSNFVDAFNSVTSQLNQSRGQNPGPLAGDSVISSVTDSMQQILTYFNSGSGSVQSLSDLGVEFTQQGTLTFDPTVLSGMNASQLQDALTFLGGATTGGFLESATNAMNGLVDPTNGLITSDLAGLNQQATNDAQQVQNQQDQITTLTNNLTSQMSAADTLISSLENQTSFLTQLFATTNANNMAGA